TLRIDVLTIQCDRAGHARAWNAVIHAVETAQEGRLAAARGPDRGEHLPARDIDRHALERLLVAVEDADIATGEYRVDDGDLPQRARRGAALERFGKVHAAARLEVEATFAEATRRTRATGFGPSGLLDHVFFRQRRYPHLPVT